MDKDIIHNNWSYLDDQDKKEELFKIEIPTQEKEETKKHKSLLFWFFLFSLTLLLISISYFGYKYFFDKNKVSSEKIVFNNSMPNDVKAGEIDDFKIEVNNANKTTLKDVKLKFSYQKGFTREGETEIITKEIYFGDIKSSTYIATSSDYIFIGSEGDIRKVKFILSYKIDGSDADFNKMVEKEVRISTPLATVKIGGPKEIVEDYENVFTFKVKNLSLKNFLRSKLIVEMPTGFVIKKNQKEDANYFLIDSLNIGEEREYKVTGYFKNSIGEVKNIRSYLSVIKENDEVGTSYANDIYEVKINNSAINYKTEIDVSGEKIQYFSKNKDGINLDNILEIELENKSEDSVTELNVILLNKITKEEYKWNMNTNTDLDTLSPAKNVKVKTKINNFIIGQNSYYIEIYGKKRGEFNTVLLKKGDILIEGK